MPVKQKSIQISPIKLSTKVNIDSANTEETFGVLRILGRSAFWYSIKSIYWNSPVHPFANNQASDGSAMSRLVAAFLSAGAIFLVLAAVAIAPPFDWLDRLTPEVRWTIEISSWIVAAIEATLIVMVFRISRGPHDQLDQR